MQPACVFIFDKKLVEKLSRPERHEIYDVVRRGPAQLARLRHPRLLEIHSVCERSEREHVMHLMPLADDVA